MVYTPLMMNRLNQLGIVELSLIKYIVPIQPQYVGIVVGNNFSSIKRIEIRFGVSICFKKCNTHNGFKFPALIISTHKNNITDLWDTIHYIQMLVKYAKNTPIKYIDDVDTSVNRLINLEDRIRNKTRVEPDRIFKLCSSDVTKIQIDSK